MTYKCHFRGTIREKPGTSAALWICICYSLVKFSRSRAALWLATSECSFYDGRSPSWRGHGNGKSQLAECATEIAGERHEQEAFRTAEANFAHCSRVVRLSSAATEAVAATRPLGKRNQVRFYRSPVGCSFYDGYRDGGRGNLGTRNRLLAVVAVRDLRASCASANEPCESRGSTSWRSSLDDRKNIGCYRDKRNGRFQKQDSDEQ